jgi:hypothetical protein
VAIPRAGRKAGSTAVSLVPAANSYNDSTRRASSSGTPDTTIGGAGASVVVVVVAGAVVVVDGGTGVVSLAWEAAVHAATITRATRGDASRIERFTGQRR